MRKQVDLNRMPEEEVKALEQGVQGGSLGSLLYERGEARELRRYNPEYKLWVIVREAENANGNSAKNILHILGEEYSKRKVMELIKHAQEEAGRTGMI